MNESILFSLTILSSPVRNISSSIKFSSVSLGEQTKTQCAFFFLRQLNTSPHHMSLLTAVLLSSVLCIIAGYLWTLRSRYDHLKKRGITGPDPLFFFGHYRTLWSVPWYSRQLQEWTRQFGSIYGLFEGTPPMYVVSDVEFLQEVYVKQFSSFHSRRLPFIMKASTGHRVHVFGASGARWRRQRQVINPTFSAAKLKLMSPLVRECIQSLMAKLATTHGQFNIYVMYKRLTMDVICK